MPSDQIHVATIGKTIGLKGELKLHITTDFPEQFKKDSIFKSEIGELKIIHYNTNRSSVIFDNYLSIEDSKQLVNKNLYVSIENSINSISLSKDEYFWFDIIGCQVIEDGKDFGEIVDIQRIGPNDYLEIKNSKKTFLLPYIDRYVSEVDIDKKIIIGIDVQDILEAS